MNRMMKMVRKMVNLSHGSDMSSLNASWQKGHEVKLRNRINSIPYYSNQACRARQEGGDEAERKYWNDLYQIYLASTQGYTGSDLMVKLRRNNQVIGRR